MKFLKSLVCISIIFSLILSMFTPICSAIEIDNILSTEKVETIEIPCAYSSAVSIETTQLELVTEQSNSIGIPQNLHAITSTSSNITKFIWDSVSGAENYTIDFNNGQLTYNTTNANFSISGLALNTLYSVKVRANTQEENGSWSDEYTFQLLSGTISNNLNLHNHINYIVPKSVVLGSNIELNIESGTKIFVYNNISITVNGILNITGTSEESVLITSINDPANGGAGSTYWGGIIVGTTGLVDADYLTMRYGKFTVNGDLNLQNSSLSNCKDYGIYNYLSSVSDINIKNNNFTSAIYVKDSGYASFVIEENTISNANGYPFCVDLSGTAVSNDIYSYLMNENNTVSCLRNGIEIKGNVSTNKSLVSGITYYVSSSFSVNSGAELNISDDIDIYVLSSNTLTVNGILNINGTSEESILITSINDPANGGAGTTYWGGITVSTTGLVDADYLTMRYGKFTVNGDLDLQNSSLSNCKDYSIYNYLTSASDINVKNNNFASAIYVKDSGYNSLVIEDNTMSNTNGYPFCVDLSGTAVNNDIYSHLMNENNTASCLRNGIEIKGNVSTNKTLVSEITYYVSSSFSVNSGAELNISDDIDIYVLSSNTLTVNGILNINGTSEEPVLITSINDPANGGAGTTYWGGIIVGTTGLVDADYLTMRYGKFTVNGDLDLQYSSLSNCKDYSIYNYLTSVSDISVKNNNFTSAIYVKDSGYNSFVIEDNTMSNTNGYPFCVDLSGTAVNNDIYSYLMNENNTASCLRNGMEIKGNVSTNKTLPSNIDYYLTANITINSSITMNISQNSRLIVLGSQKITVDGTLNINGTEENEVMITSINDLDLGGTGNTYWGGIVVNSSGSLLCTYTSIKYGSIISYGNLQVNNSSISQTNTYALSIYMSDEATIEVKNNHIFSNVYLKNNGDNDFTFVDNTISKTNGYPIYVDISGTNTTGEFFDKINDDNTLSGNYLDVVSFGGVLSQNLTILNDSYLKYAIAGTVTIPQGITLTIQPGIVLMMSAGIIVNGTFISNATESERTVLTYYKDSAYGGTGSTLNYYNYEYWSGIDINNTGKADMDFTDLKYYKIGNNYGELNVSNSYFYAQRNCWNISTNNKTIEISNSVFYSFYDSIVASLSSTEFCFDNNTLYGRLGSVENNGLVINSTKYFNESIFSVCGNKFIINSGLARYFPIVVNMNDFNDALYKKISNNTVISGSTNKELDTIGLKGTSLTYSKTLDNSIKHYIFLSSLVIPADVTVNVQPGVTMSFVNNATINVSGVINLNGTEEERIAILPYIYSGWIAREYTTVADGLWSGFIIQEQGTANINCTDIALTEYYSYYVKTAFSVYGRLNLIGSSIFYNNSYNRQTRGCYIYLDTDIVPEIHYNCFVSAYGVEDYVGRKQRGNKAFINARAETMVIDVGDNYWGTDSGPSVDGSTNGFLISEGFDLGLSILDKNSFGKTGTSSVSGNFSFSKTDLQFVAPGYNVDITRTYNSRSDSDSVFGQGWSLNFESEADVYRYNVYGDEREIVILKLPNGSVCSFSKTNGSYVSDSCRHSLIKDENENYVLTTKEQFIYVYNSNGDLISMSDKNGNVINIEINDDGNVECITDSVGRKCDINYNEDGHISMIKDFAGREISYIYNENGQLISVINANGNVSQQYSHDPHGLITSVTNGMGETENIITYYYNDVPSMCKVHTVTDSYGKITTYSYDYTNKLTTKTDQKGNVTSDYYNDNGYIIKSVDPEGRFILTEYYNSFGDIKSVTDRNGNTTKYNIDSNGNVIKIINPDNSYKQMTYDDKNSVTSLRDEDGKMSFFIYDDKCNLLKNIQPINGTDTYSSESNVNDFVITEYVYYTDEECDDLNYHCKGLLKTETSPIGVVTSYEYDSVGNITKKSIGSNNITEYEYDSIGRCIKETDANGLKREYDYDSNGNLLRETVNSEAVTRYVFDDANRQIRIISPQEYDETKDDLNNLLFTSYEYEDDEVGEHYTYNSAGKTTSFKDNEGYVTLYTYDIYGNVISQTLPSGGIYIYEYDSLNRKTKVNYKETENSNTESLEEYTYSVLDDKNTQVIYKKYYDNETFSTVTQTFNYANKLIKTVNSGGLVDTITYNLNGTVSRLTKGDYSETYDYDGLNREVKRWVSVDNDSYIYSEVAYDKAGNRIRESVGNVYVSSTNAATNDLTTNTFTYSELGLLTSMSDADGLKFAYTYDNCGNLIKEEKYSSSTEKQTIEYTYNDFGQISKKTYYVKSGELVEDVPENKLIEEYSYDLNGNLIKTKDHLGNEHIFTYDSQNRMISNSVECADETGEIVNSTVSYSYNWDDKVLSYTDANRNTTNNVYSNRGFLLKEIDANEGVTRYYYDNAGRVSSFIKPQNYNSNLTLAQTPHTKFTYDSSDRVVLETEYFYNNETSSFEEFATKAYKYDEYGNVVKELDALGYAAGEGETVSEKIDSGYGVEYTYDLLCQRLTELDPVSKDRDIDFTNKYEYDTFGRVITQTDVNGTVTRNTYNTNGNVLLIERKAKESNNFDTILTATYDKMGNCLSSTDANQNTTTYQYNSLNKIMRIDYPHDETIGEYTEYFRYDGLGNLIKSWDSLGKQTVYTYDSFSRVLTTTEQKTDGSQSVTTSKRYDKNGNLRFYTDGNGNTVTYTYDDLNRLVSETLDGKSVTFSYDDSGNLLSTTDWLGNSYTNVYDSMGRLVEEKDPYGVTFASYVYLNNGAVSSSYDALNNETVYEYDKNARPISVTDPMGHINSQTYDNAGNMASVTDGNGKTLFYTYDHNGNLLSVNGQEEETATYTYDLKGNLTSVTDSLNNTKFYEYNCVDLLIKEIDVGGKTVVDGAVEYDSSKVEYSFYYPNGLLKLVNDRNSNALSGQSVGTETSYGTHYTYDIHGNLLSKIAKNANGVSDSSQFTYDLNGNVLTMQDVTGTTTMTYDCFNRVVTKTAPNIGTLTYSYDQTQGLTAGHNSIVSTDPKGNVVKKVYDKAQKLVKVVDNNDETVYNYLANGSLSSVEYESGIREEYSYYSNGQLQTLVNKAADETVIESYSYSYDSADNLTSKTDAKGTTTYTYDGLNRLIGIAEPNGKTTSYEFSNGNIVEKVETLGASSKITEYVYDVRNRNTSKTISEVNTESEDLTAITLLYYLYQYDNNGNQISESVTPHLNGVAQTARTTAEYEYDSWNQLINAVITDENGTSTEIENKYNALGLRTFKRTGNDVLHYLLENTESILEVNANGEEIARNVYGINMISRESGNQTVNYLYNGHGDVTSLVDQAGEILASYYYDVYGKITEQTGSFDNSITFSGYTLDSETGLYYLNARMYNPDDARFLQEDTYNGNPTDILSLNIYTYCAGNPLKYIDPTGHTPTNSQSSGTNRSGYAYTGDAANSGNGSVESFEEYFSVHELTVCAALDWVLMYLDSLVYQTSQDVWRDLRNAFALPDNLKASFADTLVYLDDIKEEAAVITTATALVVGGVMVMPTSPTIGTGLVSAGVSVASKGILEFVQNGKVTGSFSDYAKTGIAGFAAGSVSMAIASYGAAAGVTGVGNSLLASTGDMAANATTQYILTGKVDPKEVIISGATGFICAEGIRQVTIAASPLRSTKSLQKYSSTQKIVNSVDDYVDDLANVTSNRKPTEIILPNKPHTNKTPGHWETILEEVDIMKNSGQYSKIYVNKGLRNEVKNVPINRRPDIMAVRWDGVIDQVEVPSKSDSINKLIVRMYNNNSMLGKRAGETRIVYIEEIVRDIL